MSITVDIADRLYDYTDEEKAASAIALYQADHNISDHAVVAIWNDELDERRAELERVIFDAVDANGSSKRAKETIPNGISLFIESESI
ncbi:hypothetical protein [Asticcacaulis machinosus]|uniref:Addiction module component n=1 Tax=Asticcacaulis machinosus TaxID=2984211 RepID=A0ABT5HEL7_9CAUL|nr:hypothetical protein [Asticcacaulis machinosus]MDC7674698.1 hypothetical protein [Asticcacaulis machinosus]